MKRAALYIRVSSDEQARHGLSLDEQKHNLKEYATNQGFFIVDIYADEGTTARKAIHRRKELQRLLEDVRAGKIDVILFIKLDRWFRNVKDYYKVQEVLDSYQVDWITTQEEYNTTTTNGRLMLNLKLSIAQNESDQTSDRIKFVMEGKRRRREALTGNVPLGYKVENKKYVIDEPAAKIARDLFEFYRVNQSFYKAMDYARDKYGLVLSYGNVRNMMINESYIGTFHNIKDYAPAIIDYELFNTVQKIASIGRRADTPNRPQTPYLFSGMLFCPECGRRLVGNNNRTITKGKKYFHHVYKCSGRHHNHQCSWSGCVSEKILEAYLLKYIEDFIADYRVHLDVKRANATSQEEIEHRIQAAKGKLSRLKDLYVTGCIDRNIYDNDYKKYNMELSEAMATKKKAPAAMPPSLVEILDKGIHEIYDSLSPDGRKTFWNSIIYRIKITRYEPRQRNGKEFDIEFL